MNKTQVKQGLKRFWKEMIIILSVFILYGNTLQNGFVLDDISAIVENRFVQNGMDGLGDIFTTHYRKGYWSHPGDLYRPLVLASFAIEYEFSDGSPQIHHLFNLIYYLLIGVMLYALLIRWLKSKNQYLPLIITLIFLFHPIHSEVVANIKSRDELMGFMFILLALLAATQYVLHQKAIWLIGMGFSFLMALLSKESGVVFILLIPMSMYFFLDSKKAELIKISASLLPPLVLFMLLRHQALSDQIEIPNVQFSVFSDQPLQTFLLAGYHLVLYLYKLVIPFPLSSQYPEYYLGMNTIHSIIGVGGLLLHLLLLYFGIKWFIQKKLIGYAVLFYLITSFLHSNIFLSIGTQFGERLLFIPTLAFCIILGSILVNKLPNHKQLWYAVAVIGLIYGAQVIHRNGEWESNHSLYAADVVKQPNSAMLNYWQGLELSGGDYFYSLKENQQDRSLKRALIYLEAATQLKRDYGDAEAQIGLVYYKLNKLAEALPHFEKSLAVGKGNVSTLNNIAAIYFTQNNFDKAKSYYERAVIIDPDFKDAWGNLGVTYAQLGLLDKAQVAFDKAIGFSPENAQFYFYMGMTLNQMGKSMKAKPYFEKAFELDPKLKP